MCWGCAGGYDAYRWTRTDSRGGGSGGGGNGITFYDGGAAGSDATYGGRGDSFVKPDTLAADTYRAPSCKPRCAAKPCGANDGCGGTCKRGSGCVTACGAWQAVKPGDPWTDSDPNYTGDRGCEGFKIKDFGRVGSEATCRAKCESVGAACCARDHRSDHKSCRAYSGDVIIKGGCTGCTAARCK